MLDYLAFAFICLLGAMSPGADFAIVTRFAASGSRPAAVMSSLGISAALLVHVSYCLLGVGLFLQGSPLAFRSIQIVGSLYLGYLGIKLLMIKGSSGSVAAPSKKHAFSSGFMTNLLNPKATLFVLSLFTQFIKEDSSNWIRLGYGMTMVMVTLLWFTSLSLIMTHKKMIHKFQTYQLLLCKVMGVILCLLALYVICFS
jgi:threonine/homoserine/homoserine lactone efflux protein